MSFLKRVRAGLLLILFCTPVFCEENPFPSKTLTGHTHYVHALALSADGRLLASGDGLGFVKLWKMPEGVLVGSEQCHSSHIYALAMNAAGSQLATASADKLVKMWKLYPQGNAETALRIIDRMEGHLDAVWAVILNEPGHEAYTGGWDGNIVLWNLDDLSLKATVEAGQEGVQCLALSPDGKTLYSGGRDSSIKVWDIQQKKCLQTLVAHRNWVQCLAVSPDGKTLISGSRDTAVALWSLPEGKIITVLDAHIADVMGLAISPDGNYFVSASQDGNLKFWSLPGGDPITSFKAHNSTILSLVLSKDGQTLYTGSQDKTIKAWDLSSLNVYLEHLKSGDDVLARRDPETLTNAIGEYETAMSLYATEQARKKLTHAYEVQKEVTYDIFYQKGLNAIKHRTPLNLSRASFYFDKALSISKTAEAKDYYEAVQVELKKLEQKKKQQELLKQKKKKAQEKKEAEAEEAVTPITSEVTVQE